MRTPIKVWDYLAEYAEERDDILDAVDQVFSDGELILGPSLTHFEREFAEYQDVAHAVGVDNGTNAIVLGLRALGIGPGDEVITVSNAAAATVVAIETVGATAVFVDVREADFLMDTSQVAAAVTDRTRAVLAVHLYGQCVEMKPLLDLANRHDLRLLEDCAQAHGAHHRGRIAGSMGDVAAFSFHPTSVLGAYGDGGATISNQDDVEAAVRRLRNFGMEDKPYVVQTPGHNSRLDEVQAEILRRKLRRLPAYVAARRAVAQRYAEGLADTELVLPVVAEGNDHVHHRYVVRHPRRAAILEAMRCKGIELSINYPWPIHTMSGFTHLGCRAGALPVTERLAAEIFSLPMYPLLAPQVQDRVIQVLRDVLASV